MGKTITKLSELDGIFGRWSDPKENKDIQGVLKSNDSTIDMITSESFNHDFFDDDEHPIINGFLANGNEITLWGCIRSNYTVSFPGLPRFVFSPTYIFLGKQYETEEIKLKQISATFDGFPRWVGEKCFFQQNSDENTKGITVSYSAPRFDKVTCGNKEIFVSCEAKAHSDSFSSYDIDQKMWVTISYDSEVMWTEAFSDLYDYAEFLTFCMGSKCIPSLIRAKDVDGDNIAIFENTEPERTKLKKHFLVEYADIKDNYSEILNNWYIKQEEISPVISYFVDAHSVERIVKSIPRFLRMAQALESFSRKLRKSTLVSPEEHQNRIEKIISQIEAEDDKKWLEEILSTPVINEPSCQQRITSLLYEIPYEALNIKKRKLRSLSYKIVVTRNYYTHFNDSLKDNILDSHELLYASTFMKYVLRMLLGKELGLNMDKMVSRMRIDSEFGTAVNELKLLN